MVAPAGSSTRHPKAGDDAAMQEGAQPEWLTVEEVAAILRISRAAAYQAVNNGEIPGVCRNGKIIRVKRKSFEAMGDE